jgi:hypothetical protein
LAQAWNAPKNRRNEHKPFSHRRNTPTLGFIPALEGAILHKLARFYSITMDLGCRVV